MSGAVAQRANTMTKRFGGRATFFYALTREFLAWQNTRVVVELADGVRREGPMHDVIVANGHWHGGGMKLAAGRGSRTTASSTSSSSETSTSSTFSRPRRSCTAAATSRTRRWSCCGLPSLAISASEPLPLEVDGEPIGVTPARFEVVPAALRLRVPAA